SSARRSFQPARLQPYQESRPGRTGGASLSAGRALRVILSSSCVPAMAASGYDENSIMAASITAPSEQALPAERFFRTSLSLLILTSTITLVSTGKLDIVTSFAAPLIVLFKGIRWWNGRPAELSHRAATFCVLAYLAFFPIDAVFLSRFSVGNSANPPLFAWLVATVHFLIF